eukprot:5131153-Prymnesium_polylepis.1
MQSSSVRFPRRSRRIIPVVSIPGNCVSVAIVMLKLGTWPLLRRRFSCTQQQRAPWLWRDSLQNGA